MAKKEKKRKIKAVFPKHHRSFWTRFSNLPSSVSLEPTPTPAPVFYLILLVQKITSIAWICLREDETIVLVFSLSMLAKLKY